MKFEINRTKIKGGCQSGRKVVTPDSKIDLPLGIARHMVEFPGQFDVLTRFFKIIS